MSLVTDAQEHEAEEDIRAALRRALRDLARAKAKTDDLVEAAYKGARDATTAEFARKPVPRPKPDARKKSGEVALWHLTDWQGAKLTTTYDREIMWRRVHQFVDKAEEMTAIMRADHPVRSATILFGGDMVEGLFNFPTQPYEVDATLFDQWVSVSRLIQEVVLRALGMYESVQVVAEWGNHGRIGSKRDAVPASDNVDRMCYEFARQLLASEPRLRWFDCPEDIQKVEIGNYRALLLHGDETGRNGYVSPKTFTDYLNRLKAGGYGWDFHDVYTGHYHSHTEGVLSGGGSWFQTGSTESGNRYARNSMGVSGEPSQRLHFIHPDKGVVTWQQKIRLD